LNRSVSGDIDLLPSQMMHIPQSARVETACSDDGGTDIRTPSAQWAASGRILEESITSS
jgi:hypothetical protein